MWRTPPSWHFILGMLSGMAVLAAINVIFDVRERPRPPAFGDPPKQAYVGCLVVCRDPAFDSRIDFQMPEDMCRTVEVNHCQHQPLFVPRQLTLPVPRLCYFSEDIQGMR